MPGTDPRRNFALADYLDAFREHYPEQYERHGYPVRALANWAEHRRAGADQVPRRFVPLRERTLSVQQNAWAASRPGDLRWLGASRSYKGLVHLKSPFDLVLYSSLIWELRPRTVIEFGALQGASGLWFADQLDVLLGAGEVHSFEVFDKCISPRATHPRLTFHHADLRDLDTLDAELFARLPHPWLVVDDAHTNLEALAPYLNRFLETGDYYVWEDMLLVQWRTLAAIENAVGIAEACGLLVDRKYTDAFGVNVTTSPNSWFRKC